MTRYDIISRGAVSFVSAIKLATPAPEDIKAVAVLREGSYSGGTPLFFRVREFFCFVFFATGPSCGVC